jgi:hypothetical protein
MGRTFLGELQEIRRQRDSGRGVDERVEGAVEGTYKHNSISKRTRRHQNVRRLIRLQKKIN